MRRERVRLHDMVVRHNYTESIVQVRNKQGSVLKTVNSTELVPGDAIIIPNTGGVLSYDAVIVSGMELPC